LGEGLFGRPVRLRTWDLVEEPSGEVNKGKGPRNFKKRGVGGVFKKRHLLGMLVKKKIIMCMTSGKTRSKLETTNVSKLA